MTGTASRNLHALAVTLERLPKSSMIAAAKAAKKIAADQGRLEGSPLAGSRVQRGRRAITLKARDDIRDTPTGATMRIQGIPAGVWVWRNTGTRAHDIRRRKRGPKKNMTVRHPGTRGRGAWRKVQARCAVVIPEIFVDDVHLAVRRRA